MTEDIKKRYVGKITYIEKAKGYGFISSREIPFTKIFFHWTGLNNGNINFIEIDKGMEVEFETMEVPEKGIRAVKIDVLEDEDKNDKNDGLAENSGGSDK